VKLLVIAPHPDDEVLGCGGTMCRLAAEGHEVVVAIMTRGWEPLFPESQVAQVRAEARAANARLGVARVEFVDLPATRLHALPEHELNAAVDELVDAERPGWVFLPHPGDRHEDHRQLFDAAMVALRPVRGRDHIRRIWCYETVSETHWAAAQIEPNFEPHTWVDISGQLETKLEAMKLYASQVQPGPGPRSLAAVEALAVWRGSVVSLEAAECFVVVRELI
jgi:LmbE family N-acetylglucosaminyl deacetylase